jgi:small subunit ribosomal protein S9
MAEDKKQTGKTGESQDKAADSEAAASTRLTFAASQPPAEKHYWWGTGRRKRAVARVRIRPGTGQFTVNKREAAAYFNEEKDRQAVVSPLETVNMMKSWDIWANVAGGGFTGQAGAVTLGLARAIAKAVPETETLLRDRGLLTRDARMSERKKYGRKGARKRFQFSKR